jgi:predicted transposase/invertase (TIGR01784 family)
MNENIIIVPKILPPSDDGIFKTLLTKPEAKDILKDLISSIINIPVLSVEVRNNELPIENAFEKQERFDVSCTIDGGKQIELEMQSENMEGDNLDNNHANIKNRSIYYLCDLHSSQSARGVTYGSLMKTYQITFCGYTIFENRENFVNPFSMKNGDSEELTDAINLVFIELSKLSGILKKPVNEMTAIELWSLFFRYADDERYEPIIREIAAVKEEILMANEILNNISQNEDERAKFRARKKWQSDYEHTMIMRELKGKAEGRVEGRVEGEIQKAYTIARNMLADSESIDKIQRYTGLSPEQIKNL